MKKKLTKKQMDKIYEGLAAAGLKNVRISTMHLVPTDGPKRGVQTMAGNNCHAQLVNGHWVIVCD